MTPWAELLLNPVGATDDLVRAKFHELARGQHPDLRVAGAAGCPGPRWYALTAAYAAVKTAQARAAWERARDRAAQCCGACSGTGVAVKVLGPGRGVTVCQACRGNGTIKEPEKGWRK